MENPLRKSPVDFGVNPAKVELRGEWQVALSYPGAEPGPKLVDLTHLSKWDLQDTDLSKYTPWGVAVPEKYGECAFENGVLINRMNRTQCYIWHLTTQAPEAPQEPVYTDLTDCHCLLAVTGPKALEVMERVSNLDFGKPGLATPYLFQGLVEHIPCQVVLLSKEGDEATVLFSFSRGYGQTMAEAILHSGADLGLKPGGELDIIN